METGGAVNTPERFLFFESITDRGEDGHIVICPEDSLFALWGEFCISYVCLHCNWSFQQTREFVVRKGSSVNKTDGIFNRFASSRYAGIGVPGRGSSGKIARKG